MTCIAGKIERLCWHGVWVSEEPCARCDAGETTPPGFNPIKGLVDLTIDTPSNDQDKAR